jgi:protein-S-isoprenylcysteine O-methyltransferase Ste14
MRHVFKDAFAYAPFVFVFAVFFGFLITWGIAYVFGFAEAISWSTLAANALGAGVVIIFTAIDKIYKSVKRINKIVEFTKIDFDEAAKLVSILRYRIDEEPEDWDLYQFHCDYQRYKQRDEL